MHKDLTIAVVGGGFSGTMAAIHLSRTLPSQVRIKLIERSGHFARGVAYADSAVPHLLNVRAANMSAFASAPGHFEHWLQRCGERADVYETPAGQFSSRRLYGRYLQEILLAAPERIQLCVADIRKLERAGDKWRLQAADGESILADGVVLACGNLPPETGNEGLEYHNPWHANALRGLNPSGTVLIVGSGLTMIDLVTSLRTNGFQGDIVSLSRRGLLPHVHAAIPQSWPTPSFSAAERASPTGLLRAVRQQVKQAAAQGIGWRSVIDSLRPITAALWRGLDTAAQARFLRHLRAYWDVHRHRMAPCIGTALADWQRTGALQNLRGRVQRVVETSGGTAQVFITQQGGKGSLVLEVQRIIHAKGLHILQSGDGFLNHLLDTGTVQADGLGLGLVVDDDFAVLSRTGPKVPGLWAIGPLVRGTFWECLAVPDIRVQAWRLGQHIEAALREGQTPWGLTLHSH